MDSVQFLVWDFLASVHDGPCRNVSFAPARSKSSAMLTDVEESLEMIATFVLRTIPEKEE